MEKTRVTNNNAIKRAILALQESSKYEVTLTEFDGMECYLINGVISVVPILRKYKNLETGEIGELPPFTSKAEAQKLIRQALAKASDHFRSINQQKIF